jgi:transposase
MAPYKETSRGQGLLLPIDLSEQLIPGTYEDTLNRLLDSEIDIRIFDLKYRNDDTGAPAIELRILLKIILYCYYMGVTSSRKIAKLCKALTRFVLRGEEKVSIQWQLYCIVHNIGKCNMALRSKKVLKSA